MPAASSSLLVRLPDEIKRYLESLAETTGRSTDHLVLEALERYLAEEAQLIEGINTGIAELDAGLGVPQEEVLDGLFMINAVAVDDDDEAESRVLSPADSRRVAVLVGRQAQRLLTEEEWTELEELVARYGQLLHERRLRARARRRGVSLEQERR